MDTNDFELINAQITGITYIENSFVITQGEEFALPPTFGRQGSTWTMTVLADRKGSPQVAQAFDSKAGGPQHEFADSFVDQSPEELNFFFGAVVTFEVAGSSIPLTLYFGQGHRGLRNNWWIGGSAVQSADKESVLVVGGGPNPIVYRIDAGISTMTLVPA